MIFSYDFSTQKHLKESCWRFTTIQFSKSIWIENFLTRYLLRHEKMYLVLVYALKWSRPRYRADSDSSILPARNLDWSWQLYIVCTSERPRIPYLRRLWATMPRTRYYTIHLDYCLGPYFSKLPICKSRLLTVGNVYQLKSRNLFFVSQLLVLLICSVSHVCAYVPYLRSQLSSSDFFSSKAFWLSSANFSWACLRSFANSVASWRTFFLACSMVGFSSK